MTGVERSCCASGIEAEAIASLVCHTRKPQSIWPGARQKLTRSDPSPRIYRERCLFISHDADQRPIVVFIREDLEVNDAKLRRVVAAAVSPLTNVPECGLCFGFCWLVSIA